MTLVPGAIVAAIATVWSLLTAPTHAAFICVPPTKLDLLPPAVKFAGGCALADRTCFNSFPTLNATTPFGAGANTFSAGFVVDGAYGGVVGVGALNPADQSSALFPVSASKFIVNPWLNASDVRPFAGCAQTCVCTAGSPCPAVDPSFARSIVQPQCVNGYLLEDFEAFYCIQFSRVAGSGQRLPAAVDGLRVPNANLAVTLSYSVVSDPNVLNSTRTVTFQNGAYRSLPDGSELHALSLKGATEAFLFLSCGAFVLHDSVRGTLIETASSSRATFIPFLVSVANATVVEGNATTTSLVFRVTLYPPHPHAVSVRFATTNGTAVAGSDFVGQTGTVSFAPNQTEKTVSIVVKGDTDYEVDEVFALVLSNPVGTLIGNGSAIGVIRNDEVPPTLSITDVSLAEGNSKTTSFAFVVTQSFPTGTTTTVNFTVVPGSASPGADFVAQSGVITFAVGETSKTLIVAVVGDTVIEYNKTFTVQLSDPFGATLLKASAVGTIINDDFPTLSISSPAPVLEGNDGARPTIMFVVALSATPSTPVTVNYATVAGTATSASRDYVGATGKLTFAAGTTALTQPVLVTVIGDLVYETNESFSVALSSPTQATIVGAVSATGTIANDDTLPAFWISDVTQAEGDNGTTPFTFTVSMVASAVAATVQYATVAVGGATAGVDFVARSETLVFAPSETAKNVTVLVNGDSELEPSENFLVVLTGAVDATIGDPVGVGVISNDDGPCQCEK